MIKYVRTFDMPSPYSVYSDEREAFIKTTSTPVEVVPEQVDASLLEWHSKQPWSRSPYEVFEAYNEDGTFLGLYSAPVGRPTPNQVALCPQLERAYSPGKYLTFGSSVRIIPQSYGWELEWDLHPHLIRSVKSTGVITRDRFHYICAQLLIHTQRDERDEE